MELENYNNLVKYLTDLTQLNNLNKTQLSKLKHQASFYIIREGMLYRKGRKEGESPIRVVKIMEVEIILYNMHSDPLAGYFRIENTIKKIKTRYYWPTMIKDIRNYE